MFQNEASWAWRRRRNDRTRVPCATRRRTMRTSSSRAECGPAASATASSDAGPSTPLPVRLNSGGKHYTKRPRLQLCRWYLLSTCVSCIIVRVPTRTGDMGRNFPVRKKSGNLNRLEKSGKIAQNTGKQGISDKCYIILVIFKRTVYCLLKQIKFSV